MLLLGSLTVAQTPAGEIDWRSRAEVGLVVQYPWELENTSQIWRIASRAERDHAYAVRIARESGPAAEASRVVDEDESFEALRRGRLTQLFHRLELDGARHRTAYRAHLERVGHDRGRIEFLLRVHAGAPRPQEWSLPAPLRPQGAPLLERSLRELGA